MKRIILCADDYGQNMAVSQGIIELCQLNRLSAASCLSSSSYWSTHAEWLKPFKDKIKVGLHFNLTEGRPLSRVFRKKYGNEFPKLNSVLLNAYLNKLDREAITVEWNAQLEEFIKFFHRPPDFVDGHQHVHQLPTIRDILFEIYERNLRLSKVFIRSTEIRNYLFHFGSGYFKKIMIQLCGAKPFAKELIQRNILHNNSFSGIYHFSNAANYAKLFPQFLRESLDGGLIMCHPGLQSEDQLQDKIAESRFHEYQYFKSEAFLRDCETQKCNL